MLQSLARLRPWYHINLWDLVLYHSNIHVKWADPLDFCMDILVSTLQIRSATGFSIRPILKWEMTKSQPARRVNRYQAKHVVPTVVTTQPKLNEDSPRFQNIKSFLPAITSRHGQSLRSHTNPCVSKPQQDSGCPCRSEVTSGDHHLKSRQERAANLLWRKTELAFPSEWLFLLRLTAC